MTQIPASAGDGDNPFFADWTAVGTANINMNIEKASRSAPSPARLKPAWVRVV